MADEIHVGDVGTQLLGTVTDDEVAVDISGATTKVFLFTKPDGTQINRTANFLTTGTDGKLQYTTVANDLDLEGEWKIQGHIAMPSGNWHTKISRFTVLGNLG